MSKPRSSSGKDSREPRSGRTRKGGEAASERNNRMRPVGDLMGNVGGMAFRRFGFVQSSIVSRWSEIVGERYAKVSSPESISFPAGKKSGGVLTLLVEGAHSPLLQHLTPLIIERVNRFFGYAAITRVVFRQGRAATTRIDLARPKPQPVPREVGEGLREIADPELRTCLESLAAALAGSTGGPLIEMPDPLTLPANSRSEKPE